MASGDANTFWSDNDEKSGEFSAEPEWLREARGVLPHSLSGELFHLEADPQQTINLFGRRPEKVEELRKLLDELRASKADSES